MLLVRDVDGYVRYRESSSISGGSISINTDEVAFGTGTSLTSSVNFKFDTTCNNLIASSKGGEIINSENSVILGGECFYFTSPYGYYGKSGGNQIIGGRNNLVTGGIFCQAFGFKFSYPNRVYNSLSGAILAGHTNTIGTSSFSSIIGGRVNTLTDTSNFSSIIGGGTNTLNHNSCYSSIIGGLGNTIDGESKQSSIIGGGSNTISITSLNSSIIGGSSNTINCGLGSSIIGGELNTLTFSIYRSAIIGGCCNTIGTQSNNSIIIGGQNLNLTYQSNTVLLQHLWIAGSMSPNCGTNFGITDNVVISGSASLCFVNGILVSVAP